MLIMLHTKETGEARLFNSDWISETRPLDKEDPGEGTTVYTGADNLSTSVMESQSQIQALEQVAMIPRWVGGR